MNLDDIQGKDLSHKSHLLTILILVYTDVDEGVRLYKKLMSELREQDYRVLIIDNDAKDKHTLRENIPHESLILNEQNKGYAGGNNSGIKQCLVDNDSYVMILNPDIDVTVDTIDNLVSHMEKDKEIAFMGPRISYRNKPNIIYSDGGMVNKRQGFKVTHLNYNKEESQVNKGLIDVDYMNGSALLGRVAAIRQFGMLNEHFFIYFEETEWCLRAKDRGWKVITNTNLKAYHISSAKSRKYHFLMKRNKIWLAKIRNEFFLRTVLYTAKEIFIALLSFNKRLVPFVYGFVHGVFYHPTHSEKSNQRFFRL